MYNSHQIKKLEEQTTNLWRVSRAWQGKSEVEMTTGDAIHICCTIREESEPKSMVRKYNNKLLNELIRGSTSSLPEQSSVIPFMKAQQA